MEWERPDVFAVVLEGSINGYRYDQVKELE